MNKKYLMKGLAALAIVAGISSCVKDVDGVTPAQEAEQAKENAELQLGIVIPDGQTWDMASQVEANVTVDLAAGETYSVAVYSNDPFADGKGVILAKGSIKSGSTFSDNFTCGKDRQRLWVAVTDKNNYTLYKIADVENGKISVDFSEATAGSRSMRALSVNGDVYNKFPAPGDVASYFPTEIPGDAKTDAEIEAAWKGKYAVDENGEEIIAWGNKVQMWDMYAIYLNMVGKVINNIKVTAPGEYSVGHNWANPADRVYNVYINIGNGNELTLKRNGAEHVNFYIMSGNVTIDSNFGECGGIISVAKDAIVNDQRNHVAHNDGIKIFNKGTWNATNSEGYDIGNFCTFYNAGKLNVTGPLSYSPGDANTSYLVNYGSDAELTAPSMTLNSAGNFFNSGKAIIAGETNVTQKDIYWVNNGFYQTGSMTFSAKNATFYNYCQLIIKGNAHMYDGEFNLMTDSYCEAATAEFDNFIVNMANNAGFKVLGDTKWEAQGDGTYQGFKAATGAEAFVYLGGTATVAGHLHTLETSGNVNCAIGAINDLGASNTGVQPTYVFSKAIANAKDVNFIAPTEEECAGTWKKGGTPKYETLQVYTYAFEDQTLNTDYDMNDVVLKVSYVVDEEGTGENAGKVVYNKKKLNVTLVALGATYEITAKIGGADLFKGQELHAAMEQKKGIMINTAGTGGNSISGVATQKCIVDAPAKWNGEFESLPVSIHVSTTNKDYSFPNNDAYPHAVMIPVDWAWPTERTNVIKAYPKFKNWATSTDTPRADSDWYNKENAVEGNVVQNN